MARLNCVLVGFMLLICMPLSAATLRLSENFDDQSIDSHLTPRIYGAVASLGEYSWGDGRGGSGYSYGSGTINATFLEWGGAYGTPPGTWYTDEIYVSFWMRYPTYTWCGANDNIKFFYPTFGSNDGCEFVLNSNNGAFYMLYNNKNSFQDIYGANSWGYPTLTNQADGNWRHYEFYINFSTGIIRFWYDDAETPTVERNMGSSWTTEADMKNREIQVCLPWHVNCS